MNRSQIREKAGNLLFLSAAILCIFAVAAIFIFLILKSIPALQKIGIWKFLSGKEWIPDRQDLYTSESLAGSYGILPMLAGTLAVTAGALLFGGITGYFTAVFLVFFCPQKLKPLFRTVIRLLAGIPSVVYGFFGITVLLPRLSLFAPNNGSGLLATSLILGIMILPTVVSLSATGLEAVPHAYYEGAVALGATHAQTVFGIMVPAARSSISAALILGVGRALGETMAVVMVAGNAPTFPNGIFQSFRALTANIVMEMGYAGEVQEGALVGGGAVLLAFVLLINLLFAKISNPSAKKKKGDRNTTVSPLFRLKGSVRNWYGRLPSAQIGKVLSICAGCLCGAILLWIIGFIFSKGLSSLLSNPHLLVGKYEFGSEKITLLPTIVTTLMAVFASILIAVPLGVMTAVFLHEYTSRSNGFVRIIRHAIDILSGVPSIVYGLFGMLAFVPLFGGTSSLLAGSLTVSIMLLPTVIRATEESLKSVSDALREGSLALGAGKLRTVLRIVLPSALPGIFSAIILSIGRVIGESAPFLYTMGSVIGALPRSYFDSGATLAVALYQLSGEGWYFEEAYAAAVILILLVLGLNLLADGVFAKLQKKRKG